MGDSGPNKMGDLRMTFGEHIEELRWRLIKAIGGAVVGTILCFSFGKKIMAFLCQPLYAALRSNEQDPYVTALRPPDVFLVYIKMCFVVGLVVTCPWVLYQIWAFIAGGLYSREKRYVRTFGPFSVVLFVTGVAFCYYVVVPISLNFLIRFTNMFPAPPVDRVVSTESRPAMLPGPTIPVVSRDPVAPRDGQIWFDATTNQLKIHVLPKGESQDAQPQGRTWIAHFTPGDRASMVRPAYSLADYISFVTTMAMAFGIGFQVPIVVIFLAWSGIVEIEDISRARGYVILALVMLAAVLTPPDVQSQILLAIPMWGLFELGLILARVLPARLRRPDDESETEREE